MARILRQVTVVRDGQHNAFTDLQFWQDCYWVSYRKGAAHVSLDGEAVISVSVDRTRFREVAHLKVPGDNRDPKLVPMSDERMATIFPSWVGGHTRRHLQQYVSFTNDGFNWETPVPILEPHWWLWRVVKHEGRYYGTAYTYRHRTTGEERCNSTDFVVSDDMLHWERISQIGSDDLKLGEAGIHFQPDGEAWVVSRSGSAGQSSYFCTAKPPYTEWHINSLNTLIHAPVILEHEGSLYVSGRRNAEMEGDTSFPFLDRYSLGVWRLQRDDSGQGSVEPVLRIPAAGDCSYPGLIKDPQGRICLSYYSQHAYHMGVEPYPFRREAEAPYNTGGLLTPDDVYFAELELP